MSTHAHYAGELGSRRQTPALAKDPAYRAARAEHFAREAQRAGEAHRVASTPSERSQHALVVAHAAQMSRKHAKAAEQLAPGSEHAHHAREAHAEASRQHESVTMREADASQRQTQKIENKSMRDIAVQPRARAASLSPEEKVRTAAVHEQMKSSQDIFRRLEHHEEHVMGAAVTQPLQIVKEETGYRMSSAAISKSTIAGGTKAGQLEAEQMHRSAAKIERARGNHELADKHELAASLHNQARESIRRLENARGPIAARSARKSAERYAQEAQDVFRR